MESIKNLLIHWELRRKTYKLIDKKPLKQMIINKRKNRQIEINEKTFDVVKTKEENRSASKVGYYIFAFLFRILVVN